MLQFVGSQRVGQDLATEQQKKQIRAGGMSSAPGVCMFFNLPALALGLGKVIFFSRTLSGTLCFSPRLI